MNIRITVTHSQYTVFHVLPGRFDVLGGAGWPVCTISVMNRYNKLQSPRIRDIDLPANNTEQAPIAPIRPHKQYECTLQTPPVPRSKSGQDTLSSYILYIMDCTKKAEANELLYFRYLPPDREYQRRCLVHLPAHHDCCTAE